MKTYQLTTYAKKLLADTLTPVSIYLKLRDQYPNSLLLESSDYHANDNSFSYICSNPIASIKVENNRIFTQFPDGSLEEESATNKTVIKAISNFTKRFIIEDNQSYKFIHNCIFGYTA